MHAIGISPNAVSDDELAERARTGQEAIFQRIAQRRGCLPVELPRIPVKELAALVGEEMGTKPPVPGVILNSLGRFTEAIG